MDNEINETTVGFVEPSDPRGQGTTARYLRTLGGALMRVDREPDRGLAMWICGACGAGNAYGWPLERPTPYRHATEDEAWSTAQDQALAHAHACRVPPRIAGARATPVIASNASGGRGCDENAGREVMVEVDQRLPLVHQPLVELVETICEGLVDLVAEHTGVRMPHILIGVTTWWGMRRWRLAEALAVTGRPRRWPGLRVHATYLWDTVRSRSTGFALAIPDSADGVTILINATAAARCGLSVRRLLLHELRHAAQLADPSHRALVVDQIRHDTRVERRDQAWLDRIDQVIEQDEAEACAAEDWTWAALNAHRAALDAEQQADIDQQAARDREEAERGNTRTACTWCDDEFYVPKDEPGPHSCQTCRYKNGY